MRIVCDRCMLALSCVDQNCINILLAAPLGKKKSLSATMADDIVDASKIDPEDIIDAEYDDIPEERCKQFEA